MRHSKIIFSTLTLAIFSTAHVPALCQGLPPTTLDSFVHQAGAQAELIYGDEGTVAEPPLFGFHKENRINAGIFGQRDAGLTTGHGSYMPDAWGADEFIAPPGEWGWSGSSNHATVNNHVQPPFPTDMNGPAPDIIDAHSELNFDTDF